MIRCPRCAQEKADDEFRRHPARPNGREAYCRPCSNSYQSEWRQSSRSHQERARARQRRGFTQAQADEMLARQGGRCAVCLTEHPGARGWCLDHCHATGANRGLLCNNCNRALGYFKDDPERMERAIVYLRTAFSALL